jgi:hypothetical protein
LLVVAVNVFASPMAAQPGVSTRIASVDFYGLTTVPDSEARRVLGIVPGAPIPDSALRATAIERLGALHGVRRGSLEFVCCAAEGGVMLYVGIEERGAPAMQFANAPTGTVRLPAEIAAAGASFDSAFMDAMAHGDFAETDTAGHSVMHWPAAAAVQRRFVTLAAQYTPELRAVLHHSADAAQRALAAQVLGYVADKRTVVSDLAEALFDPDRIVRNNSTRSLWVIAMLAQRRPELGVRVPYDRFVDMLASPAWSDRNKASLALTQLTAGHSATLLDLLRARSMSSLVEMAHWHDFSHAVAALTILGRIVGMPEADIMVALGQGDREPILHALALFTTQHSLRP